MSACVHRTSGRIRYAISQALHKGPIVFPHLYKRGFTNPHLSREDQHALPPTFALILLQKLLDEAGQRLHGIPVYQVKLEHKVQEVLEVAIQVRLTSKVLKIVEMVNVGVRVHSEEALAQLLDHGEESWCACSQELT